MSRLIVVVALLVLATCGAPAQGRKRPSFKGPGRTFDGESSRLSKTRVVPALDARIEPGENLVWCGSFQRAWDVFRDDLLDGDPLRIRETGDLCSRLNAAKLPEEDLPPGGVVAEAGRMGPELVAKIREQMSRRFSDAPLPDLSGPEGSLLAYAYLAANVSFAIPFFENDEPLEFRPAGGGGTQVTSFGLREKDDYAYYKLREQVDVLFERNIYDQDKAAAREFILDPDRSSKPSQVVLACVTPKTDLARTIAYVNERIANAEKEVGYRPDMGPNDVLLVPDLHFRVRHRFEELEGAEKKLLNTGFEAFWVDKAMQTIEFRLDKSGADLESEAKLHCLPIPAHYVFDRPFLILMRRRGAERPYFAMWVGNAELLRVFEKDD